MNKDMIELIWHSLSIEFKNKVDANGIAREPFLAGLPMARALVLRPE